MSIVDYEQALKLGQKKYREQTSKGAYPYLPVLDEILARTEIESRVNLGTIDIPLEMLVGTSTEGRTTAFASNFMPLLEPASEFAMKWGSLIDALIDEGQRDPIVAYEFMNRFYVVEGNKRVSVSKYLGTVSVSGTVTRLVPKRTDELENKIYYEFLDFYALSSINYIWFSKEGSFPKLLKYLDLDPAFVWTKEVRTLFKSAWLAFSKEYKALGGDRLSITTGDAMLSYLEVFSYTSLLEDSGSEIRKNIEKIWDEFLIQEQDDSIALLMDPNEKPVKKGLLSKLIPSAPLRLKVAFIHHKTVETSAWTYSHELGRTHIEQVFGDQIETCCIDNIEPGEDASRAIEKAIADGYKIIFTTTPEFINASLKAAVEHPDIKILNCSLNTSHRYIRTYYGRMHEAKLLTGIIAGAITTNDKIGYIADYPIFGMAANINAFALGARMVNPRAKIYLEWSTRKGADPYETFKEKGITVISNKEMVTPQHPSRQFGLYIQEKDFQTNLAMPVWHWGNMYEKILKSIINGGWKEDDASDTLQALNYWWGMSAGVIDLIHSMKLPTETQRLLEIMKSCVCTVRFHTFSGVLYDQSGQQRCGQGQDLTPEEIITMDWLLDNVIGEIPTLDELIDDAKEVVMQQGLAITEAR